MHLPISIGNRFRLFFALDFAGIGVFFPFLALYLSSRGLSGSQVGLLLALFPFVGFLVQPVWGVVTDLYRVHRAVLVLACFGLALVSVLFGRTTNFQSLLLLTLLLAILKSPIMPTSNALALEYLEREARQNAFGSLRLWGSLGFALSSFLIGTFLLDDALWGIPYVYSLISAAQGLLSLTIPHGEVHGKVHLREGLALLRRERSLPSFLLAILLISATVGIGNNYLSVYLDEIGAAGWIVGVTIGVSALLEAPFMAQVPAFLARWGVRLTLVAGVSLLPVRWLLYTVIDDPLLVLPTQLLHSLALTALIIVGVLYVDRLLPPRWRASGQSLYAAVFMGLGPGLGLFMGGWLYEREGITALWVASTVLALLGTLLLAASLRPPRTLEVPVEQPATPL